jgi:hypothetical protein
VKSRGAWPAARITHGRRQTRSQVQDFTVS